MTKIGDVPLSSLKVGDKVISCTGKPGVIGGVYTAIERDPWGYSRWDDWDGSVLFLWSENTYSITGWSGCEVTYLGETRNG